MNRNNRLLFLSLAITLLLLTGCAGPLSKDLLKQADQSLNLDRAAKNPDSVKGTLVVWGGTILSTSPREKTTVIEVLDRPLDYRKRPKDLDTYRGRFLAHVKGFLDPAVFCKGRDVTVIGRITGSESSLIGSYSYTYPSVSVEEYYLWPTYPAYDYSTAPYYPYYPYYGPWWWY